MKRRDFRPIADYISRYKKVSAPDNYLAQIQSIWNEAVGDAIASNSHPNSERDGVVRVTCTSSVWAQELELMSPQIVEKVNEILGDSWLKGIEARVGR